MSCLPTRDIATLVGITERAVHRILGDLQKEGYLRRQRDGRRNRYDVRRDPPLPHPIERHAPISALLKLVS